MRWANIELGHYRWLPILDFLLVGIAAVLTSLRSIYLPHPVYAYSGFSTPVLLRNVSLALGLLLRSAIDPSSAARAFYRRIGGVLGLLTVLRVLFPGDLNPVFAIIRPALFLAVGVLAVSWQRVPDQAPEQSGRRAALRLFLSLSATVTVLLVVFLAFIAPPPYRTFMYVSVAAAAALFVTRSSLAQRSRYAAEEKLRRSEEEYRGVFEGALEGIFRTTPEGKCTAANPVLAHMLGYGSPEELVATVSDAGRQIWADASERSRVTAMVQQQGAIRGYECQFVRKDGARIWVSLNARKVPGPDGGTLYYEGFADDITDRKRAEEELRLTQFSLEHASDAVFWIDSQGRILYVNEAACRSVDCSRDELLSLSIPDINPAFSPETWSEAWETVKAQGSRTFETCHRTKTGKIFPVEITTNYLEFGSKEYAFAFARDITERKRAQEALTESRALLSTIVNSTSDLIWSVDAQAFKLLWFNQSLVDHFRPSGVHINAGMAPEDLFLSQEFRQTWHDLYQRALRDGPYTTEYSTYGSGKTLHLSFNLLRRADTVFGISVFGKDITEQKRAQVALRTSETQLREAEEMAHLGSSSWEVDTDTTSWSEEMYRIVGRDPKQPPPRHAERAALYTPESWAGLDAAVRRALESGEPYDLEVEVVRPDGAVRWAHARGAAVRNESGRIVRLHGTLQDITERKRAEEELRESEARFRTLVEDAPLGIRISRHGLTVYTNQKYLSMYGYERADELVGLPIEPQWATESWPDVEERIRRRKLGLPLPPTMEGTAQRRDGSQFPVHCDTTVVELPDGPASLTFFTDTTEHIRAEQELADRLRFETLLADVSGRFVDVPAERLDAAIEVAQRRVCESLGLDICTLWQLSPAAPGFFTLTHQSGGSPSPGHLNGQEHFPWCFQQVLAGNVVVFSSLKGLPSEAARDRETWRQFGVKSNLTIGLAIGGGPIVGALSFNTLKVECKWPEPLVKRLQLLAELFSSALARQQSEKALRESEERFRSLVENATVGIYRTTPEGKILMANPALAHMLGYHSFKELASRNLEEDGFEPSYPRSEFKSRLERDGEIAGLEEAWLRRDGTTVFVRESARAIRAEDGRVVFYDGIVEDITQRKQAEEEVLFKNTLLEAQAETTLDGILVADESARVLFANRQIREIWKVPDDVSLPEDHVTFLRQGSAQLENPESFLARLKYLYANPMEKSRDEFEFKDGRVIDRYSSPLTGPTGKYYGRIWYLRDITERKRAEEALRASESRFRTLIEKAPAAVGISRNGRTVYVNQKYLEMYGFRTMDELIGRPISEQWAPEAATEVAERALQRSRGIPVPTTYDALGQRKDGSRFPVHVEVSVVDLPDGPASLAFLTDITERKRAEEQIRESEEKFRKAFMTGTDAGDIATLSEGRIVEVNDRFKDVFGYDRGEVIGKTSIELGLYMNPSEGQKMVAGLLTKGHVRDMEFRGSRKDGQLISALISANVLEEKKEQLVLGVVRDITE